MVIVIEYAAPVRQENLGAAQVYLMRAAGPMAKTTVFNYRVGQAYSGLELVARLPGEPTLAKVRCPKARRVDVSRPSPT